MAGCGDIGRLFPTTRSRFDRDSVSANLNYLSGRSLTTGTMTRRRPFNRVIVRGNIAEAIEQLQKLEQRAADGILTEVELQLGLSHAYHHLNLAWNIRRISTSEYSRLTQE